MLKKNIFIRSLLIILLICIVFQNSIYGLEDNNQYVIDNNNSEQKNNIRNWIYRPWDNVSIDIKNDVYNKIAISDDYPKEIKDVIFKQFNYIETQMKELGVDNCEGIYNYAEIIIMPNAFENGKIRMYYLNNKNEIQFEEYCIKNAKLPQIQYKTELKGKITDDLILLDIDKYNNKSALNVSIALEGILTDDYLYDNITKNNIDDRILRGLCYGREDIDYWIFSVQDSATKEIKEIKVNSCQRKANCKFNLEIPYNSYVNLIDRDSKRIDISYRGWIELVFNDGKRIEITDYVGSSFKSMNTEEVLIKNKHEKVTQDELLNPIEVKIQAPNEMFDVEKFKVIDKTDYKNVVDRKVKIDGIFLSDEQSNEFIAGEWLFELKGKDEIYNYEIIYVDKNGVEYIYKSFVKVYTIKPKAEMIIKGDMKENRKILVINNSKIVNSNYYNENASIEVIEFGIIESDKNKVYIGNHNKDAIEFSIINPFEDVCIELKLKTKIKKDLIERTDVPINYFFSDNYSNCIQVVPDYSPSIFFNIINKKYLRNDKLELSYEAVSLDGDDISEEIISICYDENGKNNFSQCIYRGNIQGLNDFIFEKLGNYKLTAEVYEKEIDKAYIVSGSPADGKRVKNYVEKIISVENLAPFTKIYVETHNYYPEIDLFFIFDSKYNVEKSNAIKESNIDIINMCHKEQLNAGIQIWDLNRSEEKKEISISKESFEEYPSSNILYSNDGYEGVLELYNVGNNKTIIEYWLDEEIEKSKYVEEFGTGKSWTKYVKNVRVDGGSTNTPTIPYSKDGYSGTLNKISWKVSSVEDGRDEEGTGTVRVNYLALYGGTVSGLFQEKVKKYREKNNYIGYYKGQAIKKYNDIFNPKFRDTSDRYIVYFCEDSVNNINSLDSIKAVGDCKVILVRNVYENNSVTWADYYIDNKKSVDDINKEIVKCINDKRVKESEIVMLVNDRISIKHEDYDLENDKINEIGSQVVHYPMFYDNEQGQEENTYLVFKESAYERIKMPIKFNKPGKYEIYRKVVDIPEGYEEKSEANDSKIIVLVHRKPIANCEAEYTYNTEENVYNISWIDNSYDLDFQYRDPEWKKGIRQQKMKYRTVGDDNWIFSTPYKLEPGEYEIVYYVKDNYNIWSEPFYYSLILPHYTPPVIENIMIYAYGNSEYIYENDDVNFSMDIEFNSADKINVKGELYSNDDSNNMVSFFEKEITHKDSPLERLKMKLIDNIPLGDYVLKIQIYDGHSVLSKNIDIKANDLWVNGNVGHSENWEKNRLIYNEKYPDKPRDDDTFWNGETFVVNCETTTINPKSSVECRRVTVEVLDDKNPNDEKYVKILDKNSVGNKWTINYWDKGWISKNGYAIVKWGDNEKKELILKLTAYYSNDWIETKNIKVYVDNTIEFWRLRRNW